MIFKSKDIEYAISNTFNRYRVNIWHKDSKFHRENRPAIIYADGSKS
jgi:hypothetical protein